MEIKLLKKGYKDNEQFYEDFLNDRILQNEEYFSENNIFIKEAPDFPIYMASKDTGERQRMFLQAFETLRESYLGTERDLHLDEVFWHSLLILKKRDFLLETYPQIKESFSEFRKVVTKNFDWENYIYKCVLGAEYVNDIISDESNRQHYYKLIVNNLDLYNYMIKYEVFRNGPFIINILSIIDELDLSDIMKKQITWRNDLGRDPRVGRHVLLEFNKSYPVVMSPMLEKDELKNYFLEFLGYYYDLSELSLPV